MDNSSLQPIYANVYDKDYQIFVGGNGKYYLHDPDHTLPFAHVALPPDKTQTTGMSGLGVSPTSQAGIQVGIAALNFVPVVGPILSGIAEAVDSIFGGGDPTPASTLWSNVIALRVQVAQLNNQIQGAPIDTFQVPPGLDPTSDGPAGGNTGNVLSAAIVAQVLNLASSDIHDVKRAQYYSAITALQNQVATLKQKLTTQQTVAQAIAAVQPTEPMPYIVGQPAPIAIPQTNVNVTPSSPNTPIQSSTPPQSTSQATMNGSQFINQYWPYLLGGGILLAVAASTRK